MRRIALVTLMLVTVGSVTMTAQVPGAQRATTEPAELPVKQILVRIAGRLGVRFTIEADCRDSNRRSTLVAGTIPAPDSLTDPARIIDYLAKAMPEVSIRTEADNPKLVHLIDKSLLADGDYALSRRISLTFTGPTYELFQAVIAQSHGGLGFPITVANSDATVDETPVSAKAVDMPVRAVLSVFQPLAAYEAVVWEAECYKREGESDYVALHYIPKDKLTRSSTGPAKPAAP